MMKTLQQGDILNAKWRHGQARTNPVFLELLGALGAGKYGEVWRGKAKEEPTSPEFAVKIAHPALANDEMRQFQAEVLTLDDLRQGEQSLLAQPEADSSNSVFPQVLAIPYDDKQGRYFFVETLAQGQPLDELLRRDLRWHEADALTLVTQLCRVFWVMHDVLKQSYLDYQPRNVFWDREHRRVMVIDFNLLSNADQVDYALDLERVVQVLHRLLLGKYATLPLPNDPKYWGTVSLGTRRILKRGLHPQKERRFVSSRELYKALASLSRDWDADGGELLADISASLNQTPAAPSYANYIALADRLEIAHRKTTDEKNDNPALLRLMQLLENQLQNSKPHAGLLGEVASAYRKRDIEKAKIELAEAVADCVTVEDGLSIHRWQRILNDSIANNPEKICNILAQLSEHDETQISSLDKGFESVAEQNIPTWLQAELKLRKLAFDLNKYENILNDLHAQVDIIQLQPVLKICQAATENLKILNDQVLAQSLPDFEGWAKHVEQRIKTLNAINAQIEELTQSDLPKLRERLQKGGSRDADGIRTLSTHELSLIVDRCKDELEKAQGSQTVRQIQAVLYEIPLNLLSADTRKACDDLIMQTQQHRRWYAMLDRIENEIKVVVEAAEKPVEAASAQPVIFDLEKDISKAEIKALKAYPLWERLWAVLGQVAVVSPDGAIATYLKQLDETRWNEIWQKHAAAKTEWHTLRQTTRADVLRKYLDTAKTYAISVPTQSREALEKAHKFADTADDRTLIENCEAEILAIKTNSVEASLEARRIRRINEAKKAREADEKRVIAELESMERDARDKLSSHILREREAGLAMYEEIKDLAKKYSLMPEHNALTVRHTLAKQQVDELIKDWLDAEAAKGTNDYVKALEHYRVLIARGVKAGNYGEDIHIYITQLKSKIPYSPPNINPIINGSNSYKKNNDATVYRDRSGSSPQQKSPNDLLQDLKATTNDLKECPHSANRCENNAENLLKIIRLAKNFTEDPIFENAVTDAVETIIKSCMALKQEKGWIDKLKNNYLKEINSSLPNELHKTRTQLTNYIKETQQQSR